MAESLISQLPKLTLADAVPTLPLDRATGELRSGDFAAILGAQLFDLDGSHPEAAAPDIGKTNTDPTASSQWDELLATLPEDVAEAIRAATEDGGDTPAALVSLLEHGFAEIAPAFAPTGTAHPAASSSLGSSEPDPAESGQTGTAPGVPAHNRQSELHPPVPQLNASVSATPSTPRFSGPAPVGPPPALFVHPVPVTSAPNRQPPGQTRPAEALGASRSSLQDQAQSRVATNSVRATALAANALVAVGRMRTATQMEHLPTASQTRPDQPVSNRPSQPRISEPAPQFRARSTLLAEVAPVRANTDNPAPAFSMPAATSGAIALSFAGLPVAEDSWLPQHGNLAESLAGTGVLSQPPAAALADIGERPVLSLARVAPGRAARGALLPDGSAPPARGNEPLQVSAPNRPSSPDAAARPVAETNTAAPRATSIVPLLSSGTSDWSGAGASAPFEGGPTRSPQTPNVSPVALPMDANSGGASTAVRVTTQPGADPFPPARLPGDVPSRDPTAAQARKGVSTGAPAHGQGVPFGPTFPTATHTAAPSNHHDVGRADLPDSLAARMVSTPLLSAATTTQATTSPISLPLGPVHGIAKSGDADTDLTVFPAVDPGRVPTTGSAASAQPSTGNAVLARSLAAQISAAAPQPGGAPVELRLNPDELGRVRLSITHGEGTITMLISAERAETLDLMRRHIALLEAEFREIGYSDIRFAFGSPGRGHDGFGAQPGDGSAHPFDSEPDNDLPTATEVQHRATSGLSAGPDGLDLRL